MVSNRWRIVMTPVAALILGSPLLMDCGALPQVPGGIPGMADCPDMANADAVAKFDWTKNFKLNAEASGKLKGGLTAAIELKGLAAEVDAELAVACNGLAKDLGGKGDAKGAPDACKAAIAAMGDLKAKMGASAKVSLDLQPPVCSASMNAMADCAGECDASVKGGKAEVKCEGGEISGECGAKCEGACHMEAAATCSGTCEGSCDASFSGKCGGKCDGKCDGKATGAGGAECKGTCSGKCDAGAKGECKGKCDGSCQLKGGAECKGTCSGKCSVEMKEPKCSGKIEPPKVSAECKAHCDAKVSGKVECTPARVALKIEGAADAGAAAKYKAAIEKNLPKVLKIAIGMKDRLASVAGNVKTVVEGAQGTVKGAVSGGPALAAQLTACVAAPFTGALDAAASLKASVNVSVDVKASASASGSASAGGKGAPESASPELAPLE